MSKKASVEQRGWQKVLLNDNPFAIVPSRMAESIKWADVIDLKREIESRMINSMQTSPSCIVLNWGEWGGGKTHAGLYFTQQHILKELAKRAGTSLPIAFPVSLPRASKDVIKVMYLDILGKLGFQNLWHCLQKLHKALQSSKSHRIFFRLTGNEEFAESFTKLSQLESKDEDYNLLRAYFNLNMTKADLRKLGLARDIESITDMINILTTILNIMVYGDSPSLPLYSELFLWIDELDDILSLPTKEQDMLRNFLRDLIDYVPNNLTLFLNFTLKTPLKFEDISSYLGDACLSRARYKLNFSQLTEENALKYIKDLLSFSQIKEKVPTDFYPFEEESLKNLIAKLPLRTPRKINEECTILIESAIAEPTWKSPDSTIDGTFIRQKLPHLFGEET